MEYVPGGTLEARLATGLLPFDSIVSLGAAIADALENAHRHGVLHRDLKPGNIMLTADGHPKILDFGLAVLLSGGKATGRMTQSGVIVGSLPYMAPEQLFGEVDDARTDVYALGTMLFEMVTGRRPFVKERPEALMFAILNNAPPTVRSIRPDAPAELDRLLGECMHKDPAQRPSSAAMVGDALRRVRDGGSGITPTIPAGDTIRAIAVLPFRNVSQDPAQEYFADGMTPRESR
jgi:serine/threonine protein kinase